MEGMRWHTRSTRKTLVDFLRRTSSMPMFLDWLLQVKAAEAEAESKYLSGVGVSRQRKAIVDGLRDSVETFSKTIDGAFTLA